MSDNEIDLFSILSDQEVDAIMPMGFGAAIDGSKTARREQVIRSLRSKSVGNHVGQTCFMMLVSMGLIKDGYKSKVTPLTFRGVMLLAEVDSGKSFRYDGPLLGDDEIKAIVPNIFGVSREYNKETIDTLRQKLMEGLKRVFAGQAVDSPLFHSLSECGLVNARGMRHLTGRGKCVLGNFLGESLSDVERDNTPVTLKYNVHEDNDCWRCQDCGAEWSFAAGDSDVPEECTYCSPDQEDSGEEGIVTLVFNQSGRCLGRTRTNENLITLQYTINKAVSMGAVMGDAVDVWMLKSGEEDTPLLWTRLDKTLIATSERLLRTGDVLHYIPKGTRYHVTTTVLHPDYGNLIGYREEGQDVLYFRAANGFSDKFERCEEKSRFLQEPNPKTPAKIKMPGWSEWQKAVFNERSNMFA